ncbi:MAG TPA: PAS domain-containing protein [Micropepsaceae bacterium]|nr:PAS domain-containing protein [Micropepsaceae bacterium]
MITEGIVPGSATRLLSIDKCRPELKELYGVWQKLRQARRMPARREFDPASVRHLLPHLMLIDVFPEMARERRFRVRLHGTAQVQYQGTDWTGHYPHEKTDQAAADRLCAVGDHIVATREPWMSTGGLYWLPTKPYARFETILLPLSDDDVTVNMILGLTVFF